MKKVTKMVKSAMEIKEAIENGFSQRMIFVWSESKGYDTYGMNICTCKIGYGHDFKDIKKHSDKVGQCVGCGYDMKGSAFAQFLNVAYKEELQELNTSSYGYYKNDTKAYVNGACGMNCMLIIAYELGLKVKEEYDDRNKAYIYTLSK